MAPILANESAPICEAAENNQRKTRVDFGGAGEGGLGEGGGGRPALARLLADPLPPPRPSPPFSQAG
jgi:hypothetical protein